MTIALSWGRYGGFYIMLGRSGRVCLGWVALTWLSMEIDDLMRLAFDGREPEPGPSRLPGRGITRTPD